jgi:NAD(P)H-flavin reductase
MHPGAFPQNPAAGQPLLPAPYEVRRVSRETADTFTLELTPQDGGPGLAFAPGQFNMLYAFGRGEAPISISGDPARPDILAHTIRAVGNVTQALTRLKRGGALGVRGPYGVPWPVAQAESMDVLIIAGGLGLAPLRPAIYHLLANRAPYGNVEIIYGARTPQDLLYREELMRWRGRFDVRVHVTVDSASSDWRGGVGVVTNVIKRARFDPPHTVALVCGPGMMMRFTALELLNHGLTPAQMYLSMERNMKCGLGLCGHCQWGPFFVCKDGPVFRYDAIREWLEKREV